MQLTALDPFAYATSEKSDPANFPCTVLPTYRLVIIGNYVRRPVIGMDRMREGRGNYLAALDRARILRPDTWAVLWEGAMMQHSGYRLPYQERHLRVAFAWLDLPLRECLQRIAERQVARGRPKALVGNGRTVRSKHATIVNLVAKVRAAGGTLWQFDGFQPATVLAHQLLRRLSTL